MIDIEIILVWIKRFYIVYLEIIFASQTVEETATKENIVTKTTFSHVVICDSILN